jgi:phosphopantetheinyl transferase
LKEALLKAAGAGFSMDPRAIRLRLDAPGDPAIVSAPPVFKHASLRCFSPGSGCAAALAVMAGIPELAFFSL